jgi:hypothetical protein
MLALLVGLGSSEKGLMLLVELDCCLDIRGWYFVD